MLRVRYTGVDRAAGSRGMLVQARAGHLRIDIQVFQTISWVDNMQGYYSTLIDTKNLNYVVHCGDN